MQSPMCKVVVLASIARVTGRRRRMLKEVEIDPDESLTRRWGTRADDVRVKRAMAALQANGITVLRASDAAAAKRIVLDLIPVASPVHQGASQTLDVLGITYEIEKSGRYAALRPRIWSMDRDTEADEIRRLGVAARRRPRPGCIWHTQRGEQGCHHQPRDHAGADHCGLGRRGARVLSAPHRSAGDYISLSNPEIDAGCRDHRGQPRLGLGRYRPHPGTACAAELRDTGAERA